MSYAFPQDTVFAVSFESNLNINAEGFVEPDSMIEVTSWEWMPSYAVGSNGTRDVGVVHLVSSVGLEPVGLPDPRAAANAVGRTAVSVGYGWNSLDRSLNSPNATYASDGYRKWGTTRVGIVSPNWLTAHAAPASACYHDSGGPQFVDDVLVSFTVTGDMPCVTLQRNQRLDLPEVQEWLEQQM
jgi:hypothetical protein